MAEHSLHLFPEMDPTCKFKSYNWLEKDSMQCKKPHCIIGAFECQWIDNCIPCPLRWQWGDWNGWNDVTPEIKVRIVDDATAAVTTLASRHSILLPEINTLFDLLDATRMVQRNIEGTQTTQDTLDSIAETLVKLGEKSDRI